MILNFDVMVIYDEVYDRKLCSLQNSSRDCRSFC